MSGGALGPGNPLVTEREHKIADHETHWTRFGIVTVDACECGAVRTRLVYEGGSMASAWSGTCWLGGTRAK